MRKFFSKGSSSESPQQASPLPAEPPPPLVRSSNMAGGPARPVRFIYCHENGKFQIDPEALAVLQLVKEPLGVVSVCGRARQGKSLILNQLLGRSSGFQVAATHRPCTEGIWLWSAPLKRTALDGTEYNLLLLDTEGIDAYDQTGTHSTQIFSLAVLLSTTFIYNQMGGIDKAALDRLSLVTEMTKHISVRASAERSTAAELGQFSPIFVWLLRDFYLDLVEDNRKITPRDYLQLALRSVQGGGRDVAGKNEIRESIRTLFPDRECFTLVRPLSNENDLQRLDQIPLNELQPEFRSGVDSLTRFVFERTRPKQVGATVMTGPILVRITQSFLDALNKGAEPTITSSWQAALRESHEDAVQKAVAAFDATAVGAGSIGQNYEKRFQITFTKKAFEGKKKDAFREASVNCSITIHKMERELRSACHAPDAKLDNVLKVFHGLVSEYDLNCHGPEKWKKLTIFLRQSMEGPIHDLIKKQIDQVGSERSSLALKCRSAEDKMNLLHTQFESAEKQKFEFLKLYKDVMRDKKKLADDYLSRTTTLQGECSSLGERCTSTSKLLDSARQVSNEWKAKYEQLLYKQTAEEDQASAEIQILKSKMHATEARLAAAHEQAHFAREDARIEGVEERCKSAEREAKRATELADKARAEEVAAQKEKSEIQRTERLTDSLENEAEKLIASEMDALLSRVDSLEAEAKEREKLIESLTKSNNENRATTYQIVKRLLESERETYKEGQQREEELSLELQLTQGKVAILQRVLRMNETALDNGKRIRVSDCEMVVESSIGTNDEGSRGNKRSNKSSDGPTKYLRIS